MNSPQFLETLRALLDRGKIDKVRQGCKELLALDPGNTEAAGLLEEATRRKRLIGQGTSSIKIETLNCPSCKSPLSAREISQSVVCSTCGSVLDLNRAVNSKYGEVDLRANRPRSFLRLGKEGTLFGNKVQVIGRIRYHCSMSEWDDEDSCYTHGSWVYDEWQLVTEKKGYVFIEEDVEGYRFFQKFTPTYPQLPESNTQHVMLEQSSGRLRVMERGTATVRFFEGEFTWLPRLNDRSEYVDLGAKDPRYAIEWRISANDREIQEVEFFRGRDLSRLELLEAFGESGAKEERIKQTSDRECTIWGWAYFAISLVLFSFAVRTFGGGKAIFETTLSLDKIPVEGRLIGPIELTKKGAIHNLNLTSYIPDNTSAWGAVELLDGNFASIDAVEGDFWAETGHDSDGPWRETDLSTNHYFRLEQPGTYFARFFVERETAQTGTLTLRVYEGVPLSRYYLFGALFALGMAVAIGRFKRVNPVFAVVGLLVLGYLILKKLAEWDD